MRGELVLGGPGAARTAGNECTSWARGEAIGSIRASAAWGRIRSPGAASRGPKGGWEESGGQARWPRVRHAGPPPSRSPAAGPQAAPAPPAAPPGRGFPGRAGPFHPGSESDVGVNENKRGARGEGRPARRRERRGAGGSCRAAEVRAGGRARSRLCCGCRGSPRDVRARAGRSPSCTRRPPSRPLRAATYQRRARLGAGGGRPGRGPARREGLPRLCAYPIIAASAGPGGCTAPGSEAWRGFCTSGPTISQV